MRSDPPIYTEKTECQDCYKCIRECPVQAIKVESGSASIMSDLCILCGKCINICPKGAKKVRDDLQEAKKLLSDCGKVIASIDPSFVTEFSGVEPTQLIAGLKALGFYGVSESSLGAELVSMHADRLLEQSNKSIFISSACPTIVQYLRRYRPEYAGHITSLLSPSLAHARLLRETYGPEIDIIHIGPCIAKKWESDVHPELIDVALTFEDLRHWLKEENIDLKSIKKSSKDVFIPRRANDGALYPVVGGMIESIRGRRKKGLQAQFISFSGIRRLKNALKGFDELEPEGNLFLELTACFGGCVNGPRSMSRSATVCKRYKITQYARPASPKMAEEIDIHEDYPPEVVPQAVYSEDQIKEALHQVGKFEEKDELNCGGCGYDSCRDFVCALIGDKAEKAMCVAYMRSLAQKKANILIQKMPSAAVIVDDQLNIVEYNPNFVGLFGQDVDDTEGGTRLEGANLRDLLPFHELFQGVLLSGEEVVETDLRFQGRILHGIIFSIEKHSLVGALFGDITMPAMQREQIIKRARHVIEQNLMTVQKIAYLMGENAAESEIILNSIVESFSAKGMDDNND